MSEDLVNVEVDGVARKGEKGAMSIQGTEPSEDYVPECC